MNESDLAAQRCIECKMSARQVRGRPVIDHTRTCAYAGRQTAVDDEEAWTRREERVMRMLGVDPADVTSWREVYGLGRPREDGERP